MKPAAHVIEQFVIAMLSNPNTNFTNAEKVIKDAMIHAEAFQKAMNKLEGEQQAVVATLIRETMAKEEVVGEHLVQTHDPLIITEENLSKPLGKIKHEKPDYNAVKRRLK